MAYLSTSDNFLLVYGNSDTHDLSNGGGTVMLTSTLSLSSFCSSEELQTGVGQRGNYSHGFLKDMHNFSSSFICYLFFLNLMERETRTLQNCL